MRLIICMLQQHCIASRHVSNLCFITIVFIAGLLFTTIFLVSLDPDDRTILFIPKKKVNERVASCNEEMYECHLNARWLRWPLVEEELRWCISVKVVKLQWRIQFSSIQFILHSPISQMINLPQRALRSVHIRHPWPLTSHRIRKNSQEIEKNPLGEKSEETFRKATEEDPSPG